MREFSIPAHQGKSPQEIVGGTEFDSANYLFHSMCWLDYAERAGTFQPLLYACSDARSGIEYLLFEELVLSTGANLSEEDYRKCTRERNRFVKTIDQLSPHYRKLKTFAKIVVSLEPHAPTLIEWDLKALMRIWGDLSHYLHWNGARNLTTEDAAWVTNARSRIRAVVEPLWINITSGRSGLIHPRDMHPSALQVWEAYRDGHINEESVRFQLRVLRPVGA